MGEIAEMMLDGTLCEGCGEYIGEATGYPGYCSAECAGEYGCTPTDYDNHHRPAKTVRCQKCGKGFRSKDARKQHQRDMGHVQ